VTSGRPDEVKKASSILSAANGSMLGTVLAGKGVLFIAPPGQAVDTFEMPDDRMVCHIALCKESAPVWEAVGLPLSKCSCVCQLGAVDMTMG
jgi:hypothetical protein